MRVSVVIDSADPDALVAFWCQALGYRLALSPAQYRVLVPADGQPPGPVVVLQRVPEARSAKNRMHLDLHPADAADHVAALERAGGRRVGERVTEMSETLGIWWQVMADPEGNEFCVVAEPPRQDPA